jgi:hypothetical protein
MAARFVQGWSLREAIRACVLSLSGPTRTLRADDLEVAVLEHGPWRRAFRRVGDDEVTGLLADGEPVASIEETSAPDDDTADAGEETLDTDGAAPGE